MNILFVYIYADVWRAAKIFTLANVRVEAEVKIVIY